MHIYENIIGRTIAITDEAYNLYEERMALPLMNIEVEQYTDIMLSSKDVNFEISDADLSVMVSQHIIHVAKRHTKMPASNFLVVD